MTTTKDYYEILGVARDADAKQIKAAYRRLARRFHPDVNKGDKQAEERFKEIAEAFAVLSDPQKRARYDRGGHQAFGPGFDHFAGADFRQFDIGGADFSDLIASLFGGAATRSRRPRRAAKGPDLRMELRIPFEDAIRGSTVELDIPRRGARGARVEERVKVRIPAGVDDGSTVRLAGRGDAGGPGAAAGDLYLVLRVSPDGRFTRQGRDLFCEVAVGPARATLGGAVSVPTLDGSSTIQLPPGTPSGRRFRLKGRGVPATAERPAGDLYAVIRIEPPRKLDSRSRELMEEFLQRNPGS